MRLSRYHRGFSLIEVLVAMLVLMVGILGVAAMQMVGFQTNQGAYARSQAVYLAQDMIDRMRANPRGHRATAVYDAVDSSGDIPADPACVTSMAGCTPTQMAQQDVREWAHNFVDALSGTEDYRPVLPAGRGTVSRAGNEFTVTVSWDERSWSADGSRALQSRDTDDGSCSQAAGQDCQVAITVML